MQKYTEIPSSATLAESLPLILNNDKSAISCHAGTAFPSTNLHTGMLCFRLDENKLYILTNTTPEEWRVVTQTDGDGYLLAGLNGTAIDYSKRNLDSWVDMPTGFYQGTNMLNAPKGDTNWRVLQFRENDSNGSSTQLAFGANSKSMKIRFENSGSWSDWYDIAMSKDGQISEGLNSDFLRGKYPSNEAGQIALNNSTLNKNLNADLLDGINAGNKPGEIPINNAVLNEGLNADTLHGKKPGNGKDNVALNNGKLNVGLNAEMINGVRIEGLLTTNQENSINRDTIGVTNLVSQNIRTNVIDCELIKVKNLTLGETQKRKYNDSKKHQAYSYTYEWRSDIHTYTYNYIPSISAGEYSLWEIIDKLVENSHSHTMTSSTKRCNCDCDCQD